jgi:dipeptidyl aminopeptidase/acylaminoacyl peptidase
MLDARILGESHFYETFQPGSGDFYSIGNLSVSVRDQVLAFDCTVFDTSSAPPRSMVAATSPMSALPRMIGSAGSNSILPKWSPDGERLAFLSDSAATPGVFELWTASAADPSDAAKLATLPGYVMESFDWSPSGQRILVQAAPFGAGRAGAAGGTTIVDPAREPTWEPLVKRNAAENLRRQAWIVDFDGRCDKVEAWSGYSTWEAIWCGEDALATILSEDPTDGGWYRTFLSITPREDSAPTPIPTQGQLAALAASSDGRYLAVLNGQFHRLLGAGKVLLLDRHTDQLAHFAIPAGDITSLAWRDDGRLLFAGLRSMDTVVGHIDPATNSLTIEEHESGPCGGRTPMVWPIGKSASIRVASDYHRRPTVEVRNSGGQLVEELLTLSEAFAPPPGRVRKLSWHGRDGLEIEGLLVTPDEDRAHPLVTFIHGGPVAASRPIWTLGAAVLPMLVKAGFAVFLPNPRGSFGRGADFTGRVLGDLAGEDVHDILQGIDHVIGEGLADPDRLFLFGGSYGGFLTTFIVGTSQRFRAAVAISPITHLRSQFFTAHHPEFLALYLGASPYELGGICDLRSPLINAPNVTTPILLLAGALDNTTPASQAWEYFEALRLNGSPAELVIYPQEGHGIPKRYEAQLDHALRTVEWFGQYLDV